MSTASESSTQIVGGGSGDKVRDLALTLLQPDGTVATVKVQVVAIADDNGKLLDLRDRDVEEAILEELQAIRLLIEGVL